MISKTLTGVTFFDERFGGIYRGRSMLLSGRSGSGKSVVGLQFVRQGIKQDERCLILSGRPVADLLIVAEALELLVSEDVEAGRLILLEYRDYIPGRDREDNLTLPPDGFLQLSRIIEGQAVQRLVLDTCLPWVSIHTQAKVAEHVFSFVRAFERLGLTVLMIMPKPASLPSVRLKNILEEQLPISVTLASNSDLTERTWITTKYLGETKIDQGISCEIVPRRGLVARTAGQSDPSLQHGKAPEDIPDQKLGPRPSSTAASAGQEHQPKIRFSTVIRPSSLSVPTE